MTAGEPRLVDARRVADAVLYEGYLLYPYRVSSAKNRARWQFGVLGPPGAADRALGEPSTMSLQTVLTRVTPGAGLVVHLRFLQLQHRQVYDADGVARERLTVRRDDAVGTELSWDEAVEQEVAVPVRLSPGVGHSTVERVHVDGGEQTEEVVDGSGSVVGRLVRRRWPLAAEVSATVEPLGRLHRLTVEVGNVHAVRPTTKDDATRTSLLGAHLLVEAEGCAFVSVVEPPEEARELVATLRQDRCWPFLAGEEGDDDLLLGSPIILYDHPQLAPESAGALFDATEIDEILTLRVMTMTDEEKAEARATDPRAREIIDRCDAMTPGDLQQLHGVFRDPRGPLGRPAPGLPDLGPPTITDTGGAPWWDPAADASVDPGTDVVVVAGVAVSQGSLVRVRPTRRADAQDLFFADQLARVTAVLHDVDGETHVAVVLADDPAADLHEWYGRYLYFAPHEIEPIVEHEETRP